MTHTAIVQVPAYREPNLGVTLDAIADQEPPEGWEIEYEAWVTPSCNDLSNCRTYQAAETHDVFAAQVAPKYKLSTRNEAHESAAQGGYEAIVTWDADARPAHRDVLGLMLRPLAGEPVATNGNPVPAGIDPITMLAKAASRVDDVLRPHIHGQLSAFTAEAWMEVGPFDVSMDQTDSYQVRREEEFDFLDRLSAIGSVEYVPEAVVYEPPRRVLSNLDKAFHQMTGGRRPMSDYAQRQGSETFRPDRKH